MITRYVEASVLLVSLEILKSFSFRHVPRNLLFTLVLLTPATSIAFKLETHVWIAQQVLNDVVPDGKVTIPPFGEFSVDPPIVKALQTFPNQYRMGSIGPDAFPDLAGGQVTAHPGVKEGFQTDDWLRWILGAAKDLPDIAFAYGYLTHAASDIFAHTYVNTYAGDIFDLKGEQEVELRHMALEDYIKKHNPPFLDHTGRDLGSPKNLVGTSTSPGVPAALIGKRMILNGTVAAEHRREDMAHYLAAMYDFWELQGDAIAQVDNVLERINGRIRAIQNEIQRLQNKIEEVTDKTVRVCVGVCKRVKIYPLSCFLEPSHCALVESTKVTLEATQRSLGPPQALHTLIFNTVKLPLIAWRDEVEEAVTQYIITSQEVAREIMKGKNDGRPREKINDWVCKYGTAFATLPDGVPNAIPQLGCEVNAFVRDKIFQIKSNLRHDPLLGPILEQIEEVRNDIFLTIAKALTHDDSLMVRLLNMRLNEISPASLNQEFSSDSSNKHLLNIPDIAARVNREMNVAGERKIFDPERYNVVYNAIVLSKLVLLSPSELNRMVRNMAGVQQTIYGPYLYPSINSPFNLLFGAVRSIDGNHQWQEVGLHYLRASPYTEDRPPSERMYGYKFDEPQKGFRLWQDCEVREKVFKKIFRGPVAPEIEVPQRVSSTQDPFPRSDGSKDIAKFLELSKRGSTGTNRWYVCGEMPSGVEIVEAPSPVEELDRPPAVLLLPRGDARVSKLAPGTVLRIPPVPDRTAPTLQAPPNLTVECNAAGRVGQTVDLGPAVAMDEVDEQVTVLNDAPALFPLGKTVVTWTAKDSAANVSSATQTVTVIDSAPPMFAKGLSHLTEIIDNPDGAPVGVKGPSANDICDGTVVATTNADVTALAIGDHKVRWVTRDRSGNIASLTQTISVRERKSATR